MKGKIDTFIEYLQNVKKTSENTRLSYRRDLMQLEKFLAEKDICDVADIRQEHLQAYVEHLEQQKFKPATVSRHIASIKAFFHVCGTDGK